MMLQMMRESAAPIDSFLCIDMDEPNSEEVSTRDDNIISLIHVKVILSCTMMDDSHTIIRGDDSGEITS